MKEEKVFVTSGKKKASVLKETNAVSCMRATIMHRKPTPKAATPSKCVEEKKYPRQKVILVPFFDNRILFDRSLHEIAL